VPKILDSQNQEDSLAKLDNLYGDIVNFINELGPHANLDQIIDHVQTIISHQRSLIDGTSHADKFITIDQIESMMLNLQDNLAKFDYEALLLNMKKIAGEEEIILQKKKNTSSKG
jgi:hypothetical protein